MALISMSAANAYQAYAQPWSGRKPRATREEFMEILASELLTNPYVLAENAGPSLEPGMQVHLFQVYKDSRKKCVMCGGDSHWRCTCGDSICPASTTRGEKKQCFADHLREAGDLTTPVRRYARLGTVSSA